MLYALGGKLIAAPTPEHPFFVKNTYKPAKELVKGDTLLSKTNNFIVVDKVVAVDSVLDVYNFEVEDSHNYLVGEDGVLVHNRCAYFDVVGEFAKTGLNYVESKLPSGQTLKWLKDATGKITFGGNQADLAKWVVTQANEQAHHIITWTKGGGHKLTLLAAKAGFHLNDPFNGIALVARIGGEGIHANHPNYDKYMLKLLDQEYSSTMSADDAMEAINERIIPKLLDHINIAKSQNKSLNEYFLTLL